MSRWTGSALALAVVGAIALVFALNVNPALRPPATSGTPPTYSASDTPAPQLDSAETPPNAPSSGFREWFVGEPVERGAEALEIAAVYFPAVPMEGMVMPEGEHALHLEADVRATAANRNGFALGQFIPYMKIRYEIAPETGGTPLTGDLTPMVARDGLHYGATVILPGTGRYRLTYHVDPPSAGGLGRHDDPVTGVSGWWKPFEVTWNWDYEGTASTPKSGAATADAAR